MRTLDEIVAATRSGRPVSPEELRYAVAAFDVLLHTLDLPSDYTRLQAYFTAAESDPRVYLGDANDPNNRDAQNWYRAMHDAGQAEPERDDPLGTAKCRHPDCAAFYDHNARRMSCRAMADNACARDEPGLAKPIDSEGGHSD